LQPDQAPLSISSLAPQDVRTADWVELEKQVAPYRKAKPQRPCGEPMLPTNFVLKLHPSS
jgi:hypothetical protein